MLVPLDIPAGIVSRGTDRLSVGRYQEGNLVRFYENDIMPIGGWRKLSQQAVSGAARELHTWRDNGGTLWAAIGTHTNLYVMTQSGVIHDITPDGFTAGREDSINGGGFGQGVYGVGAYGLPIVGTSNLLPASVWSFDLFGENLVACMDGDGKIYEWTPSATPSAAVVVANAPIGCTAVLVTNERILVAFGAENNPRLVQWSDSENNTEWTPQATNQAGSYQIKTQGRLSGGVLIEGGFLALTDTDVHRFDYIDSAFVYGSQLEGDGAGVISQNSAVLIDGRVIWMGQQGFWEYNGFLSSMACDIAGEVFGNLNRAQLAKVTGFNNSAYGEIWWCYPSNEGVENDRVAVYSYREGHWSTHKIARLAASDTAPFDNPLMTGADGFVYEHEVGRFHDDVKPFLTSAPLEFGSGDNVVDLMEYIPDNKVLGTVDVSFLSRYYPHEDECVSGPYDAKARTDLRINGRQHAIRYECDANVDWRIGRPRVSITIRGRR